MSIYNRFCPKTTIQFITEANIIHKNFYTYHKTIYVNSSSKIIITCPVHGDFIQRASNHTIGKGCRQCSIIRRDAAWRKVIDLSSFVRLAQTIHNNKYTYNSAKFVNSTTKLQIDCSKHGPFFQTPSNHQHGRGCPKCNASRGEIAIEIELQKYNFNIDRQIKFADCCDQRKLSFDFGIYLQDRLLGLIEYQGKQHYDSLDKFQNTGTTNESWLSYIQRHDQIKKKYCRKNNIPLLIIPYWSKNKIDSIVSNFLVDVGKSSC